MKKYFIFSLLILSACYAGHQIMTTDTFYEIDLGMSEKELKQKAGSPYATKDLGNGEKEYEYIERVKANKRTIETRHYFFIIKDGKVTSKHMKYADEYKPLLERNAYDLQTSSK